MEIPLYLALTAAEFRMCPVLPDHAAWMACHFSPYGLGLSNLPASLPENTMIIVNDRTPIHGHDPQMIADQLNVLTQKLRSSRILLDFQRAGSKETAEVVQTLVKALSCPVGVSECYAKDLPCPVFVSAPKLNAALKEHLAPWNGREIWLDAAPCSMRFTITEKGCHISDCDGSGDFPLYDHALHCHYRGEADGSSVRYYLRRSKNDLSALMEEAASYGVTTAVGLWQELK